MRVPTLSGICWSAAVAGATLLADGNGDRGPARAELRQAPGHTRGVKVTFEPVRARDGVVPHSQRLRLLSLAVERGETPTPFLPPGAFRATLRTTVTLPARDRMRFRIDGLGRAQLSLNGALVLDGAMRRNQSLETEKAVRLKKGDNDLEVVFESAARGDGQLRVFWSGLDFGFEPLAPEQLSSPVDDAEVLRGERLRMGQQLFIERRCARCHAFEELRIGESAKAELDRSGPDLRLVGARAHTGWLAAWMHDPRQFRPDASMPQFPLGDDEAADIAAFLGEQGAARPAPAFDPAAAEQGADRFRELGCVACHAMPSEDPQDASTRDRIGLGFVGQKWRAAALVAYLQEPRRHYPDVRMPDLKLSLEDATALAAYLLVDAQPLLGEGGGDASNGRRLVQKHGCHLCHQLGDDVPPGDRIHRLLHTLKPERGCLADDDGQVGDAPDHGLSDRQRAALRAFLPFAAEVAFRDSPLDFAARHLVSDRCQACHALDSQPSVWAALTQRWQLVEPVPPEQDPVAQGLPALTWVGAKLQPSWIARFVTGELASPRPWLQARMPAFAVHGAAISEGLVREHGYGSRDEPVRPADAQLAVHGLRLLEQGTGFGCVQCHAIGDKPAVQVFEREGINLTVARKRLRHEYYARWLADPTRLDPDSRMPKYANAKGRTAFTDVLGGDAGRQFEAIWQYLGALLPSGR